MPPLHSDTIGGLIQWAGQPTDDVLLAMEARAESEQFPTVGPEVGQTLALCVRLLGARSILELGSGFGYSAYWMARVLPSDGAIVLTERDKGLLDDARNYFEEGDLCESAIFEHGDALETTSNLEGLFDLVVLDHDTADYIAGFEAVRRKVSPGGAIIADNVLSYGEIQTPTGILSTLEGDTAPNDRTQTVVAYFEHVRAAPEFETYILPVGEGISISYRVESDSTGLGLTSDNDCAARRR